MRSLVAGALEAREPEWNRPKPRLCSECFAPLTEHPHAGRPKKRCGSVKCENAHTVRQRHGWRRAAGHVEWTPSLDVSTEVIAARAVFAAAVAQAKAARLRLRAAIAAVKEQTK